MKKWSTNTGTKDNTKGMFSVDASVLRCFPAQLSLLCLDWENLGSVYVSCKTFIVPLSLDKFPSAPKT